jgi:protein-tyrosine phosphatase
VWPTEDPVIAPFEVTFICTGNRFRSPLAAALLEAERRDLPLRISSFGTLELASPPALPEAIAIGSRFGVDLGEHRSRSLVGRRLADADLVLGFERAHVAYAVVDAGAPRERTFTLPELAQLLGDAREPPVEAATEIDRARARIAAAHAARTTAGTRKVPELADPLGRSRAEQERIGNELQELLVSVTRRLFR